MKPRILGIQISEDEVQITYAEDYETGKRVAVVRNLVCDVELVENDVDDIRRLAQDIIDYALESLQRRS